MTKKYNLEELIKVLHDTNFDEFVKKKSEFDFENTSRLNVISFGNTFILLKNISDHKNGKDLKPVFMGNLVYLSSADVFSIINMLQKTGMLVINSADKIKGVYFMKGEIVFASSNQPEERLGYLLYKTGKLSKEQWEEAEKAMVSGARFGSILLKKELILPKNLWWGVKYQIEEIVYSIFGITSGEFFFLEGLIPEDDLIRFSLNTQNMLMEGYRRLDEWKLIIERVPSDETMIRLSSKLPNIELTQSMKSIIEGINGEASVADVVRYSQLGRFNTYKILYTLLNAGFVEVAGTQKKEQTFDEATIKIISLIRKYNKMFEKLFATIKTTNPGFAHNELLDNFVSESSERLKKLYEDVGISEDGELDEVKLVMNLDSMKLTETDSLSKVVGVAELMLSQYMLEGLNEFLNYLIFLAKNLTTSETFEELHKEIKTIQQGA